MNPKQYFLHQIFLFKGVDMNNHMYLYKANTLQLIYDNFLEVQIGHISTQSTHPTSALNQHNRDPIRQVSPTFSFSLSHIQTNRRGRLPAKCVVQCHHRDKLASSSSPFGNGVPLCFPSSQLSSTLINDPLKHPPLVAPNYLSASTSTHCSRPIKTT
jgi:hypothetical protein